MCSSSLNSSWRKRGFTKDPNQLILITFLAIIYGFTFSLPLRRIVDWVICDIFSFFLAVPIIVFFLLFLLSDWLLSYSIIIASPRLLRYYILPVVAVPFVGISLYFVLSGYVHESMTLQSVGFQSFFVFLVFMFIYDLMLLPKLIEQERFLDNYNYFVLFFIIIVMIKILLNLMILSTTFLMLLNKTVYLVQYNTILYITYFITKLTIDLILVTTYKVFIPQQDNEDIS